VRRGAIFLVAILSLSLTAVPPAEAQTKGAVTFGGLKNLEFIQNFYNGGTGSLGSGPGKDFQLQFTSNAQVIVQAAKGGSGNFINNPGGFPVMFFQTGTNVTMTATSGVGVALWFSYSALQPGTATVYDGPNGTGNILASTTLNPNDAGCNTYAMCVWSAVGVPLSATASSIRFSGVGNYLAIGTIHLGQSLPTSTVLTSSQNPSLQGEAVTFTAAVSSTTGAIPVGTVKFKAGSKLIGQVNTVNGMASVTLSSLPQGSTKVTASFKGASFAASSASLIQVVN